MLVVTLAFSRYQFVWPTFRQTTEAVCEGLDRAWIFIGGIAKALVPDHTKAMIKDPDAVSLTLVAAFLDYAQARSIFVDPARVRLEQARCTAPRCGVATSPAHACTARRARFRVSCTTRW